jgi:diphthamide synthase (EF-2-diphthine--ammonia ligase)
MVDQGVLRECLLHDRVEEVLVIGKAPVPQLSPELEQVVVPDLFDLSSAADQMAGFDTVFFCLGVNSVGRKEPEYTRVTKDLTLSIADTVEEQWGPDVRFIHVSGGSTDSTEQGRVMEARVKGATENALLERSPGALSGCRDVPPRLHPAPARCSVQDGVGGPDLSSHLPAGAGAAAARAGICDDNRGDRARHDRRRVRPKGRRRGGRARTPATPGEPRHRRARLGLIGMSTRTRTVFHWSVGKNSAQALGRLLVDEQYAVERLVTTTSRATGRSTVHGTPPHLLRARADRIGLPLEIIELAGRDLDGYLVTMDAHGTALVEEGIAAIAFGDRQRHHGRCVVVDADHLPREALGRIVDAAFLADLAAGVDPAGELDEYHSFVIDAPFFDAPIPLETGEPVLIESVVGTTEGPAPTGGGPFRPGSAESQSRQRAVDDRAGRQVVLLIEVLHRAGLTERVDAERHGGHTER